MGNNIDFVDHIAAEQTDTYSCGIFALKNSYTIASFLNNKNQDITLEEFNKIAFTQQSEIGHLKDEYQNIYTAEEQVLERQENVRQNAITARITEIGSSEEYQKHLSAVKTKILKIGSNYQVVGEKLGENNQYKIFSRENSKNTLCVGVSFGNDRNLFDKGQYEIKVECSRNIKFLQSIQAILKEYSIQNIYHLGLMGIINKKNVTRGI